MSNRQRRQQDRERMRESILDAAMTLFSRGGIKNVSMRRIADKIGYTPGAIYRYFANKQDILHELCEQGFMLFLEEVAKQRDISDPLERLKMSGRDYLAFATRHPDYYRLMFMSGEMEWLPEEGNRPPWVAFRRFANEVQACIDCGLLKGDALSIAISLWSTFHGLASFRMENQLRFLSPEEQEAVIEQAFAFTMRSEP